MNHRATGKVDCLDTRSGIPNAVHLTRDTPNMVSHWEVDDKHPERGECHHRREFHPLGDCTDDQCGCNNCEHQLERRKDVLGNPISVIGVGC